MNRLRSVPVAVCLAGVIVGCTPEAVPTASVETISRVFVCKDDMVAIYSVGAEQHAFLKDEFETWRRAGFDGFDESFIKTPSTLLVTGVATNGVSYKIDFGQERTMIFEEAGEMVDGSRYARASTAADTRFRHFLLACIANGALPKLVSGKLPRAAD